LSLNLCNQHQYVYDVQRSIANVKTNETPGVIKNQFFVFVFIISQNWANFLRILSFCLQSSNHASILSNRGNTETLAFKTVPFGRILSFVIGNDSYNGPTM